MSHLYSRHDGTDGADLPGSRRCESAGPPRPALRARWPDACGAVRVPAGDDALRGHEAPGRPGGGGPRDDRQGRSREAPFPQSGADPSRARPLDQQVRRAGRRRDVRHQVEAGEPDGHLRSRLSPFTSRPSRSASGVPSPMATRPPATTTARASPPTGRRARPSPTRTPTARSPPTASSSRSNRGDGS